MKRTFNGVAVYPAHVSPRTETGVGVWLSQELSREEREKIMGMNKRVRGHIEVAEQRDVTVITWQVQVENRNEARIVAITLAKIVSVATGMLSVIRQLRDSRAISRALAA